MGIQSPFPVLTSFPDLFARQAQRTPDAIALIAEEAALTYEMLDLYSSQLANYLCKRGVGPETLVAICLQRSLELMIGLLAILKAGGVFVPLDPTYPADRRLWMLADSNASLLLTRRFLCTWPDSATERMVYLNEEWSQITQEPAELPSVTIMKDQLAYIIYTSGSTGSPKGAMLTHAGLTNYLCWALQTYPLDDGWGSLVHSPVSTDLTITSLFPPLLCGKTVLFLPAHFHAYKIGYILEEHPRSSFLKVTPTHLTMLSQLLAPSEVARCTHSLVIGGEALRSDHLAFWLAHSPQTRLFNEYGPTETVVGCCACELLPAHVSGDTIPIGRPIANVELYVLDDSLRQLPAGVVGELYVGGPGLARGYWQRPDLTAERFLPHPFASGKRLYRTGDMVRYRPDELLEFVGRVDRQVKIRGARIEPDEIEAVLREHPAVRDAAVLAHDGRAGDKYLIAYVLPSLAHVPSSDLRQLLAERLPEYMRPSKLVVLEAFPLMANGKIDWQALAEQE